MRVKALGQDLRSVIILGAGATRGANFDAGRAPWIKPPLDADFFEQVQRLQESHHQDAAEKLSDIARRHFGAPQSVGLEDFLNFATATDTARQSTIPAPPAPLPEQDSSMQLFRRLLPALFASARPARAGEHRQEWYVHPCAYHTTIAKNLRPGDAIISFNYDCLMDDTLRRECPGWSARDGYGVEAPVGYRDWSPQGTTEGAPSCVHLLKMHGSLNWREGKQDDESIELKMAHFDDPTEWIVPPLSAKDIAETHVFQRVWKKAWQALSEAELVAVVGYSLPQADVLAHAQFALAAEARQKPLRYLVLADPKDEVKNRVTRVFQPAVGRETRVNWLKNLEEFRQLVSPS